MTKYEVLKNITEARWKTVEILIESNDFGVAVYMMGHILECALKAAACKSLHLKGYPPSGKKIEPLFKSHVFDLLLIISGLADIFGPDGLFYNNWSTFTQYYIGDWNNIRYELGSWDEIKTKALYTELRTIINEIKKRW